MYTLYDELNRPVETGLLTTNNDRIELIEYGKSDIMSVNYSNQRNYSGQLTPSVAKDLYISELEHGRTTFEASNTIQFATGLDHSSITEQIVPDNSISFSSSITTTNNPSLSVATQVVPLTLTYYDDYSWTTKRYNAAYNNQLNKESNPLDNDYFDPLPTTHNDLVKGMATGTRIRVVASDNLNKLSNAQWMEAASFYDDKGRVVQVQNHQYKGGVDIFTTLMDFTGKPVCRYEVLTNESGNVVALPVKTNMNYDHAGRLLNIKKKVGNDEQRVVAENTYDELGQLVNKKIGRTKDDNGDLTNDPLENQDYSYNIRGWLKSINATSPNPAQAGERWFGMELSYDYGFAQNQYNGNIAGMKWYTAGSKKERAFGFGYDNANRLLFADFNQASTNSTAGWDKSANIDFSVKMGDGVHHASAYDANGNILGMWQSGLQLDRSNWIDKLSYDYGTDPTNKLKAVSDLTPNPSPGAEGSLGDFQDRNMVGNDYVYDANGNMVEDKNKFITQIHYNYLNLPYLIEVNNPTGTQGTVAYIYDATGNKLEKLVQETAPTVKNNQTTYLGGAVYENNVLKIMSHEEGRTRKQWSMVSPANGGTGGQWEAKYHFDYFLKDHLGNVRTVLTDEKKSDGYMATLEDATISFEGQLFNNLVNLVTKPTCFDNIGDNNKVQKVGAVRDLDNPSVVGQGLILKVMAGDHVDANVKAWFDNQEQGNINPTTDPLFEQLLGSLFTQGIVNAGKGDALTALTPIVLAGMNDFLTNQENFNNNNGAYLNWVLLDEEQLKYVADGSGFTGTFKEIGTSCSGNTVLQTNDGNGIDIKRNCYLYVYVSNTNTQYPVYFDDLHVVHKRGPLLEEIAYYPFGLTMEGVSSKAAGGTANKLKFNGKEEQRQEFSDGSGLEMLDFDARNYDPQIGRFMNVDPHADNYFELSPFNFVNNNPLIYIDPTGKDYAIYFEQDKKGNWNVRITATYYVKKGDQDSKNAAEYSTKFWNDESGHFVYRVNDNKEHTDYIINFDMKVVEVDDPKAELNKDKAGTDDAKTKDGSSNAFSVVDDFAIDAPGVTHAAQDIEIKKSNKDDAQTGPHEIGHTLLMQHEGTNSSSVMADGNTGAVSVNNDNVQDVIKVAFKYPTLRRISIHGNLPAKGKVKSNPN